MAGDNNNGDSPHTDGEYGFGTWILASLGMVVTVAFIFWYSTPMSC